MDDLLGWKSHEYMRVHIAYQEECAGNAVVVLLGYNNDNEVP